MLKETLIVLFLALCTRVNSEVNLNNKRSCTNKPEELENVQPLLTVQTSDPVRFINQQQNNNFYLFPILKPNPNSQTIDIHKYDPNSNILKTIIIIPPKTKKPCDRNSSTSQPEKLTTTQPCDNIKTTEKPTTTTTTVAQTTKKPCELTTTVTSQVTTSRPVTSRTTPPTKLTLNPNEVTINPNKVTPNPNDVTVNPNEVIPNPNEVTPSPSKVTPNPNKVTPNPSKVTPNPNKVTPNPSKVTPNPNKVTPNPSKVTPNPNKVTPNPNKVTPNPNEVTANPNKVTSNPNEVTLTTTINRSTRAPVTGDPDGSSKCLQDGVYRASDVTCDQFYVCIHGIQYLMDCPYGLVFNEQLKICDWLENVSDCKPPAFKDFICPDEGYGTDDDLILQFRYRDSCSQYVACHKRKARLLNCDSGYYFHEESSTCMNYRSNSNCRDVWYSY